MKGCFTIIYKGNRKRISHKCDIPFFSAIYRSSLKKLSVCFFIARDPLSVSSQIVTSDPGIRCHDSVFVEEIPCVADPLPAGLLHSASIEVIPGSVDLLPAGHHRSACTEVIVADPLVRCHHSVFVEEIPCVVDPLPAGLLYSASIEVIPGSVNLLPAR